MRCRDEEVSVNCRARLSGNLGEKALGSIGFSCQGVSCTPSVSSGAL